MDYHNHIPESAVKAIRQASENGYLVYVCTGRSKAEMQPELWEIGLDGTLVAMALMGSIMARFLCMS